MRIYDFFTFRCCNAGYSKLTMVDVPDLIISSLAIVIVVIMYV